MFTFNNTAKKERQCFECFECLRCAGVLVLVNAATAHRCVCGVNVSPPTHWPSTNNIRFLNAKWSSRERECMSTHNNNDNNNN
uniref:Uncharacterized protein n=1 Tax=Glossina brevipalpis TaxID=37001 RepID=A0A1A9WAW8_9MUSC